MNALKAAWSRISALTYVVGGMFFGVGFDSMDDLTTKSFLYLLTGAFVIFLGAMSSMEASDK